MGRGSWQAAVHGLQRVGHDWETERARACAHTHTHTHTHYPYWVRCCSTEKWKWSQSCPTLCNPVNCSLPGFSIHGIFQAKVLKWVAISFSSGSSQPRDRTQVSHIVGRHFTIWATREVLPNHVLKVYRQNSVLLQTCNFLMWFKFSNCVYLFIYFYFHHMYIYYIFRKTKKHNWKR